MKLNRSKFTHYLDILSFTIISIVSTVIMMIGIAQRESIMQPSIAFAMVYLMNLIFYRLCLEFGDKYKQKNKYTTVYFLSILYLFGILTTIALLVYLIYFACIELHDELVVEVFSSHIFYATVVGCVFAIHIAIDNTTTLYNLYLKEHK